MKRITRFISLMNRSGYLIIIDPRAKFIKTNKEIPIPIDIVQVGRKFFPLFACDKSLASIAFVSSLVMNLFCIGIWKTDLSK